MDIATYIKEGVKFQPSTKEETRDYFSGLGPEVTRSAGRKEWHLERKHLREEASEFRVHDRGSFVIKG
jgi:hypothetical protein